MADGATDFPALADEAGISPSEREEIRDHIERIVVENRIPVEATSFKPEGARRGTLLPVVVNAAAAVVIAAAVLAIALVSGGDERRLRAQETQYSSVEGRLIRELRQEASQQLGLKQREIQEVRDRLKELEARQDELARSFDDKIKRKEAEFKAQLEREIESERARLATEGVGKSEIDARIARFEADRKAYYDRELAKFRQQVDAERARMQADIDKLKSEYQTRLESLEKEQKRIAADYESRESTLRTQLEQKTRIMERLSAQRASDLEAARLELASLVKSEEGAQAIENQIDGLAARIRSSLDSGDERTALARVRELRDYLGADEVKASKRLAGRVRTDTILLGELGGLLESRIRSDEARAEGSIAESLELVSLARSLSRDAKDARDDESRLVVYKRMLSALPEIQAAADAVAAAESKAAVEKARAEYDVALAKALEEQKAAIFADESQAAKASSAARIEELGSRLAQEEARAAKAETALQADERALSDLAARAKAERGALASRVDALTAYESQVALAKTAYAKFVERDAAARKANASDPNSASRLELNKFLRGDEVKALFSDIADRVNSLYSASQSAGSSAALADAAAIVADAAKQPTIKASRQFLAFEMASLKDGDSLKAILKSVDEAMRKAEAGGQ